MPLSLQIDPRPTSYDAVIQVEEEDETGAAVNPFVETNDWAPIDPERRELPETVVFVDGVQRVEMRLIGQDNGRVVYGALASLSVGSVFYRRRGATTERGLPERVLSLSDGAGNGDVVKVDCGSETLVFQTKSSAVPGLAGVHDALTSARRHAETRIGNQLVEAGYPLVIVDGRLNFDSSRTSMAVGLIKTMQRQYLEGPQLAILSELRPGTRSPLFWIERDRAVYSWYVRLCEGRRIDHPWAGLVRLETLDAMGLQPTIQLADLTAQHLPSFASDSAWDPRAPQNLYPIAALESLLRHELGDHEWIRRHIEVHFHRQGVTV
jgi:hypothetical protein